MFVWQGNTNKTLPDQPESETLSWLLSTTTEDLYFKAEAVPYKEDENLSSHCITDDIIPVPTVNLAGVFLWVCNAPREKTRHSLLCFYCKVLHYHYTKDNHFSVWNLGSSNSSICGDHLSLPPCSDSSCCSSLNDLHMGVVKGCIMWTNVWSRMTPHRGNIHTHMFSF